MNCYIPTLVLSSLDSSLGLSTVGGVELVGSVVCWRKAASELSLLQIITALEEDPTAQKMQLGYRLQQIAAAVENKVTDL